MIPSSKVSSASPVAVKLWRDDEANPKGSWRGLLLSGIPGGGKRGPSRLWEGFSDCNPVASDLTGEISSRLLFRSDSVDGPPWSLYGAESCTPLTGAFLF